MPSSSYMPRPPRSSSLAYDPSHPPSAVTTGNTRRPARVPQSFPESRNINNPLTSSTKAVPPSFSDCRSDHDRLLYAQHTLYTVLSAHEGAKLKPTGLRKSRIPENEKTTSMWRAFWKPWVVRGKRKDENGVVKCQRSERGVRAQKFEHIP